jgi:hypothetical protein
MGIRVAVVSLAVVCALFTGSGCNIEHCEEGSTCKGDDDDSWNEGGGKECTMFCARLTLCGEVGSGFQACVDECEASFQSDPQGQATLCACAEWSSCEDLSERKCSPKPSGSGGSGGGSGGNAAGGASGSGGGAGSAGSPGTPCAHDCDCPANEYCVGGLCAPQR